MLFAELSDYLSKLAPLLGGAAVVLWAILRPSSWVAKDYRAGEAAGRAWRARQPVLSAVLAVAIIAAIVGVVIFRLS